MPQKRKYRKKKNQMTRRKPRSIPLPLGGFGKSFIAKLRYATELTLNPATGTRAIHVISANGLYDPDITGAGQQPANFDTFMEHYDHYTVLGSKLRAYSVDDTATIKVPAYLTCLKSDTGTRANSMAKTDLFEQPNLKYSRNISTNLYGNFAPVLTNTYSAKKTYGVSKSAIRALDKIQGSATGNPVDGTYYELVAWSINGNNPDACNLMVIVDYVVQFTERKPSVDS